LQGLLDRGAEEAQNPCGDEVTLREPRAAPFFFVFFFFFFSFFSFFFFF